VQGFPKAHPLKISDGRHAMARSKEAEKRGPVTGQFLRKGLNTESCIRISLLHAPARLFGNVAGSVPGAAGKYAVTAISEAKKKVVSNGGSPMLGDQVGASHCFDKLSETKFRTLSKGEGRGPGPRPAPARNSPAKFPSKVIQ